MGAANWVSGGVRRAMSGVRSALPGQDGADTEEAAEAPAAEAPAENAPPKKAPAQKAPAEKEPARKEPARKSTARKSSAKKAPANAAAAKGPAATGAATKQPASRPAAARSAGADAARGRTEDAAQGGSQGAARATAPWTDQELDAFRASLVTDITRLREELNLGQADLAEMLAHGDGAGDDQADAGAKTLDREQEMSVAANARELLDQSTHALQRLENGTYGLCESCGALIPAPRLRAFPRATLCIACKQAEERG